MNMKKILIGILEELNIKTDFDFVIKDYVSITNNLNDILNEYIINHKDDFDFNNPTFEGESKIGYKSSKNDLCLIELKPTMYSFTHNRYGIVENTDLYRNKFWNIFSRQINEEIFSIFVSGNGKYSKKVHDMVKQLIKNNKIKESYPLLTSYLGCITLNEKTYNICRFVHDETPLETVWKEWFTGTMKHDLWYVDEYPTKYEYTIKPEDKMNEIIRFDWRNPLNPKNEINKPFEERTRLSDKCIPEMFADNWIDVEDAKLTSLISSNIIKEFLSKANMTFIDTCYFINSRGNMIYSEITPDGMRIRSHEGSHDKDLWRVGKLSEEICEVWDKLLISISIYDNKKDF